MVMVMAITTVIVIMKIKITLKSVKIKVLMMPTMILTTVMVNNIMAIMLVAMKQLAKTIMLIKIIIMAIKKRSNHHDKRNINNEITIRIKVRLRSRDENLGQHSERESAKHMKFLVFF